MLFGMNSTDWQPPGGNPTGDSRVLRLPVVLPT